MDKVVGEIQDICKLMHISYDGFIRTTDPRHEEVVQKIFKKLYDQGDIYKSEYEGMYCTPCESFWTPSQLVDGKCPDCGREVQSAKEEAYFLRPSKYQQWLEDYIETHPDFIAPEGKKKEMMNNFIKPGLQDLCVSRTTFQWGIPVTFDPKHVIYVWVDALSNYITAMGYDPDGSSDQFKKYWPCDCHVIGKDIMRFHSIYWPVMLHALGLELPRQLFGHNWILFGEDKMSKSRGNVIYASDVVDAFGVDAARYYLLSEMPYGSDGSITYESLIERFNTDLANTLGNLVNRTIAMAQKYFGGVIQPADATEPVDADLRATALKTVEEVDRLMNQYRMADTLDAVISLARRSNKYIDETAPWVLAKDEANKPRLARVMYNLLETIRICGILLTPYMPYSAEKIREQIGADASIYNWETAGVYGSLPQTVTVHKGAALFPRIDMNKELAFLEERMDKQKKAAEKAAKKDEKKLEGVMIGIDDFAKVELKTAKILSCEPVKKSDKLLCLQVELGEEKRQIVSGIAEYYKPEDMVGKTVIVVSNLKPAKLRGVESQGMILAADTPDGVQVVFADGIPSGCKIR